MEAVRVQSGKEKNEMHSNMVVYRNVTRTQPAGCVHCGLKQCNPFTCKASRKSKIKVSTCSSFNYDLLSSQLLQSGSEFVMETGKEPSKTMLRGQGVCSLYFSEHTQMSLSPFT